MGTPGYRSERAITMTRSDGDTHGAAAESAPETLPPVVFFDGECGLCNHFVRWLLRVDRKRALQFAPLRGELAAEKLPQVSDNEALWSVALWDEDGIHIESDAALRAIARVGGVWRVVDGLHWIPRWFRDGVYRFIARNRIRWFGRVESCELLSPEERERILR
jgi:predicted DCC family thiol-disulfide oxidoreductase YuxK